MTEFFNFRTECLEKYDQNIYELFIELFNSMPLAALINEKYLAVHAGVSPELNQLGDIQKLN